MHAAPARLRQHGRRGPAGAVEFREFREVARACGRAPVVVVFGYAAEA